MTTQTNTMAEAFANIKAATTTSSLQERNIKRVQDLVAEFQAGRPEGYMAGVADDIKGSVLGGLIPGGDNFTNKGEFGAIMEKMGEYLEVKKFEPVNWRAVGDDVLFAVNWEMVWLATGKTVETTAIVRKVVKNGMICEKYHMIDVEAVTGVKQTEAPQVTRVKELLAEFLAGRPEGYMAGVADDIKGSVLGGLIPDADNIKNKAEFGALMEKMGDYVEMIRFEPTNFRGLLNNDMMFEVNWEMVYKPTGKKIETTAIVRKVLNEDGMICEKYHMCDVAAITKVEESPRDVLAAVGETIPEWK